MDKFAELFFQINKIVRDAVRDNYEGKPINEHEVFTKIVDIVYSIDKDNGNSAKRR